MSKGFSHFEGMGEVWSIYDQLFLLESTEHDVGAEGMLGFLDNG
jgi:hypothetical protein